MSRSRLQTFLGLHLLLMLYSLTDLFGKMAAGFELSDWRFWGFYALVIAVLGIYALGWQQVIKRLPLTTAFSSKAITVFWGLVWGVLFFQEEITPLKLLGIAVIIIGVVLFARSDDAGEMADASEKPAEPAHDRSCGCSDAKRGGAR